MKLAATAALAVTLAACTESNFFVPPIVLEQQLDNKVLVQGGFCAEGADSLKAYLKLMFIIDRSNSMQVTDPNNARVSAVAKVVDQFVENPTTLAMREGVEIALISFWGDSAVHTRNELGLNGFSRDTPEILANLFRIAQTSSNTGYDKALSQAFQVLDTDMARLDDQARALSRYEVFFLSDGLPFPDNCYDEANSLRSAVGATRRIKSLEALHKVKITVHTAFAAVPAMFDAPVPIGEETGQSCCLGVDISPISLVGDCYQTISMGEVTRKLLYEMALAGGGTFKQFDNGDDINFLEFQFSESRRLYAMSYFIAANTSAKSAVDHVDADSDRDGLTDAYETALGTSPFLRDSDGDGFSDGVEERFRLTGLDPLDPTDAQCQIFERVDSDADGYFDCEESFIGTNRRSFDSDADGLPDTVELLAGADANSATPIQDHQADADADGGTNGEELRWHTDPKADDVAERAEIAYDYDQRELPITTGQACYEFKVTNIALASTRGAPQEWSKGFCVGAAAAACSRTLPCPTGEECDLTHGLCHLPGAPWCYGDEDCLGADRCGNAKQADGWNRTMLYMAQTPYDDPLADPLYRVACVEARYVEERDLKVPASGVIDVPLRRVSDTYAPAPVLGPNPLPCQVSNNQDCGLGARWCQFADDGSSCTCCEPPTCSASHPCPGGGTCSITGTATSGVCTCSSNAQCGGGICLRDVQQNGVRFCDSINCQPCPECADGVDNDGDGKTDFPYDPDCADSVFDNEANDDQCSDGVDNDSDGSIDWPFDPGCDNWNDPDETNPATLPACSDGIENDDPSDGAVDFPRDPGCHSASDADETDSRHNGLPGCRDGVDNDGDGLTDMADPGCTDPEDIDEDGPVACFSCQRFADYVPGQCDIRAGRCKARSSLIPYLDGNNAPQNRACTDHTECRGSICDLVPSSPTRGQCVRCLRDEDCAVLPDPGPKLCDPAAGWCLRPVDPTQITACTSDANCSAGVCQTDIGYCSIDPREACASDRDCAPGSYCSTERGFCLEPIYFTRQCNPSEPCQEGTCDPDLGWCMPDQQEDQCTHSDLCPFGECLPSGACDQQTFVFPRDFRPEVDCLRPR